MYVYVKLKLLIFSVRKSKAETAVEDDDGYEDMWNLFNDADSSRNDSPNISNTDSKSLDKEDEGKGNFCQFVSL